jgi:hypothetical protein
VTPIGDEPTDEEKVLHRLLAETAPVDDTTPDLALSLSLAHKDILAVAQMVEDERDATDEKFEKVYERISKVLRLRDKHHNDAFLLITAQARQIARLERALADLRDHFDNTMNEMAAAYSAKGGEC